jgi:hypothetical protein
MVGVSIEKLKALLKERTNWNTLTRKSLHYKLKVKVNNQVLVRSGPSNKKADQLKNYFVLLHYLFYFYLKNYLAFCL